MNTESIIFNGGINNVIEPYLIQDGECQYSTNAKITSGSIEAAKEPVEDNTLVYAGDNAIYYKAQDEVVASNEDRFYVEWAGFLYWSNSAGSLKRYDGTTINDLGNHTAPLTAPTLSSTLAGLLAGEYIYTITYLHEDVFETPPCDIVASGVILNKKVTITFTDTPPVSATHRLIYRSGGLNPTLNQVAKIPVADATYIDNTPDFSISRKELTTETNEAPPPNLDMLLEKNGTLFGAIDNRVYFSKQGQPEYWSAYNYIDLPTNITGMGVSGNSIIAFTDDSMYLVSGDDIRTISMSKLPFEHGCKHKRTVKSIKGILIWLSSMDEYDILCSYDGSSVNILNVTNQEITSASIGSLQYDNLTTETYDSYIFDVKGSIAAGRKYYLYLTGRTVIVDFEFGVKTYYMSEEVDGAYEKNNQLYIIKDGKIYDYYKSNPPYRDINFTTRELSDGKLTRKKTYRKINVVGDGKWKISVKVDRATVHTFTSDDVGGLFLPSGVNGNSIVFLISSIGYAKIKGLSYEYEHKKV